MFHANRDSDTICAVSTPSGVGGISVVRVSGSQALKVARQLCSFLPENPESHRAFYGLLKDESEAVDEVVATFFAKGQSFTGEETIEISCHGSPTLTRQILELLFLKGARAAQPGEFTYRAFMSGRLDLVQAESVLSLIESQSARSGRQALRQLQGELSQVLERIENQMIWCLAHLEASIDFSTEALDVVNTPELLLKLDSLIEQITRLVHSFRKGRILKDGYNLVLTGVPNVGKSSLMNLLLEEERAIVTEIAGTTRDLIEASFMVDGLKINLMDTAGLRESSDQIEKIGIQKSYAAHGQADGIFFVFDCSRDLTEEELNQFEMLDFQRSFLIGNKRDQSKLADKDLRASLYKRLLNRGKFQKLQGLDQVLKEKLLIVSAFDKRDREVLRIAVQKDINQSQFQDNAVISQTRHFENLSRALQNLLAARNLVETSASPEFTALELKEALLRLQETLGKRFDDQIMDRVFKEFCIGK